LIEPEQQHCQRKLTPSQSSNHPETMNHILIKVARWIATLLIGSVTVAVALRTASMACWIGSATTNRSTGHLMKTRIHAAPLGLEGNGETIGYKQGAPTELSARHHP
jgi:hypothetical protein